jgi:hypothetical protein
MVCRVLRIKEESLESEKIQVDWMEDPDYVTSAAVLGGSSTGGTVRDFTIYDLVNVTVLEAPYALVGESIQIIPIAARVSGTEVGYELHCSFDGGVSYVQIDDIQNYAVHGTLVEEVSIDLNTLDKVYGFNVDFTLDIDAESIEVITRTEMFAGYNKAIIGTGNQAELITFETITPDPIVADRYKISDINRGQFDTVKKTWPAGTDFFFLDVTVQVVTSDQFLKGTTRWFKMVPYNPRYVGEISGATAIEHLIQGRAFAPYVPSNLRANGLGQNARYLNNIVLTWSPRVRGTGAGLGDPDSVTDAPPTHEGYFEIEVVVSDVVVRTVTDISAYTWTYTSAMNIADNTSLATEVTFRVVNFITTNGVRYDSIHAAEIDVAYDPNIETTTSTTTTTTTT